MENTLSKEIVNTERPYYFRTNFVPDVKTEYGPMFKLGINLEKEVNNFKSAYECYEHYVDYIFTKDIKLIQIKENERSLDEYVSFNNKPLRHFICNIILHYESIIKVCKEISFTKNIKIFFSKHLINYCLYLDLTKNDWIDKVKAQLMDTILSGPMIIKGELSEIKNLCETDGFIIRNKYYYIPTFLYENISYEKLIEKVNFIFKKTSVFRVIYRQKNQPFVLFTFYNGFNNYHKINNYWKEHIRNYHKIISNKTILENSVECKYIEYLGHFERTDFGLYCPGILDENNNTDYILLSP